MAESTKLPRPNILGSVLVKECSCSRRNGLQDGSAKYCPGPHKEYKNPPALRLHQTSSATSEHRAEAPSYKQPRPSRQRLQEPARGHESLHINPDKVSPQNQTSPVHHKPISEKNTNNSTAHGKEFVQPPSEGTANLAPPAAADPSDITNHQVSTQQQCESIHENMALEQALSVNQKPRNMNNSTYLSQANEFQQTSKREDIILDQQHSHERQKEPESPSGYSPSVTEEYEQQYAHMPCGVDKMRQKYSSNSAPSIHKMSSRSHGSENQNPSKTHSSVEETEFQLSGTDCPYEQEYAHDEAIQHISTHADSSEGHSHQETPAVTDACAPHNLQTHGGSQSYKHSSDGATCSGRELHSCKQTSSPTNYGENVPHNLQTISDSQQKMEPLTARHPTVYMSEESSNQYHEYKGNAESSTVPVNHMIPGNSYNPNVDSYQRHNNEAIRKATRDNSKIPKHQEQTLSKVSGAEAAWNQHSAQFCRPIAPARNSTSKKSINVEQSRSNISVRQSTNRKLINNEQVKADRSDTSVRCSACRELGKQPSRSSIPVRVNTGTKSVNYKQIKLDGFRGSATIKSGMSPTNVEESAQNTMEPPNFNSPRKPAIRGSVVLKSCECKRRNGLYGDNLCRVCKVMSPTPEPHNQAPGSDETSRHPVATHNDGQTGPPPVNITAPIREYTPNQETTVTSQRQVDSCNYSARHRGPDYTDNNNMGEYVSPASVAQENNYQNDSDSLANGPCGPRRQAEGQHEMTPIQELTHCHNHRGVALNEGQGCQIQDQSHNHTSHCGDSSVAHDTEPNHMTEQRYNPHKEPLIPASSSRTFQNYGEYESPPYEGHSNSPLYPASEKRPSDPRLRGIIYPDSRIPRSDTGNPATTQINFENPQRHCQQPERVRYPLKENDSTLTVIGSPQVTRCPRPH